MEFVLKRIFRKLFPFIFSTAYLTGLVICIYPIFVSATDELSEDSYEQRLHEIYTQFYRKKVSPEEWESLVSGRPSDTYVIQKDDTLWDISKVLFNDPHFWPKLWSVNTFITNPHLIRPKEALGIIPGTEGAPPTFTVIQPGLKAKPPPAGLPKEVLEKIKNIKIPPVKKVKPVLKEIPSSLPVVALVNPELAGAPFELNFDFKEMAIPSTAYLPFYMSEEPVYAEGRIINTKTYGTLSHVNGERIILKMKEPVNPGQKVSIVRDLGRLSSASLGVRGPFGYQIAVQGEAEIVKKLETGFNLYEAKVTMNLSPVTIGALIRTQEPLQFDFHRTDIMGNSEAQITGFATRSRHKPQAFPYSIAYLNRGSRNGLSIGQMYQIRANLSVRKSSQYAYDIKVGELKIIYTEGRFATALITSMKQPIKTGDYIIPLNTDTVEGDYSRIEEDEEDRIISNSDENTPFPADVEEDTGIAPTMEDAPPEEITDDEDIIPYDDELPDDEDIAIDNSDEDTPPFSDPEDDPVNSMELESAEVDRGPDSTTKPSEVNTQKGNANKPEPKGEDTDDLEIEFMEDD